MSDPPTSPARSEAELLAEYLRSRDVPCPACQYNLRGVSDGVCPECGLAVTARVAESVQHRAYWLAALSALVWPLLFNGILVGMYVFLAVDALLRKDSLRNVASDGRLPVLLVSFVLLAVSLGLLGFLLRTWSRPWRPRTRRAVLWVLGAIFALHAFWIVPMFVREML